MRQSFAQLFPEVVCVADELALDFDEHYLEREAVNAYVDQWIQRIDDITEIAKTVRRTIAEREPEPAAKLVPRELPYPLPKEITRHIGCTEWSD
jgi:hypothetical protein